MQIWALRSRSLCRVSDTQMTVKAWWPSLVPVSMFGPVWRNWPWFIWDCPQTSPPSSAGAWISSREWSPSVAGAWISNRDWSPSENWAWSGGALRHVVVVCSGCWIIFGTWGSRPDQMSSCFALTFRPKAQVSFFDQNLSLVRRRRCCKLLTFSSSEEQLGQINQTLHKKKFKFVQMKGPALFQGEIIAKIHWQI